MRSYNDHMHRRPPGRGSEWVLRECLKSGYLLDLSWATSGLDAPARIFERYWTEAVNAYLKTHQLLAKPPIRQLRRAEWRYLEPGQWTETIKNGFRDYLGQVAERILGMIRIASFP